MNYTNKQDKQAIKKAITLLMIEHDTNLKAFCEKFNYSYYKIYEKLTRNTISHDLVNEITHKLDKKRTLQRINGKLVISRT